MRTHPKLRHVQSNVLVKRIQDDLRDTLITPSTVHKQQLPQVSELTNSDISTPRRLKTLNPTDANADVRRLDHGDVIGTVADSQQDCFEVALDELDDQRFLQW